MPDLSIWIIVIYAAVNAGTFVLYGADKAKAKKGAWRVPERTLLLAAVLAPCGALLGMLVFHHKTRKPKFAVGVPMILLIEAGVYLWLIRR